MARLTIPLDDNLHQALKEAAARQGRTIGTIIEESLQFRGIKPMSSARELVAQSQRASYLSESDATDLAVAETRAHRQSQQK